MALKIFFFGDSICVGQSVSVHRTWVHKVSKKLEENFSDQIITYNPSVNGDTTRMALERMCYDVVSHKPDLLYVQFGMNDCNYWETDLGTSRVSLDGYKSNLIEITNRAFKAGIKKVFLNTSHKTFLNDKIMTDGKTTYEQSNMQYYKCLKNLQNDFSTLSDVICLDVRSYIDKYNSNPEVYLLRDGIHLNSKGHSLYFEYIYPKIHEQVSKIIGSCTSFLGN